jgi:hypothetical protein
MKHSNQHKITLIHKTGKQNGLCSHIVKKKQGKLQNFLKKHKQKYIFKHETNMKHKKTHLLLRK